MRNLFLSLLLTVTAATSIGCNRSTEGGPKVRSLTILTISDSNGLGSRAWPALLQAEVEKGLTGVSVRIVNESRAGRTLQIDRGGPETTAILGIEEWIDRARRKLRQKIDIIVICLGTNDIQKRFATREVSFAQSKGMREILRRTRLSARNTPLLVATPPPVCDSVDPELTDPSVAFAIDSRWTGAGYRLRKMESMISAEVAKTQATLVNLADEFQVSPCDAAKRDGVHLNSRGHREVARIIALAIEPMLPMRSSDSAQ